MDRARQYRLSVSRMIPLSRRSFTFEKTEPSEKKAGGRAHAKPPAVFSALAAFSISGGLTYEARDDVARARRGRPHIVQSRFSCALGCRSFHRHEQSLDGPDGSVA